MKCKAFPNIFKQVFIRNSPESILATIVIAALGSRPMADPFKGEAARPRKQADDHDRKR
jgi:hypothetical protein